MASRAEYIRGSVLYFFLFSAYGCVEPFLPLIWRSKGLSEHQVGMLGAVLPLVCFFVTPFLCSLADRYSIQQQMLIAALLSYPIARFSVLLASSFLAVALVEMLTALVKSPIGSLINAFVIHSSGTDGYGNQRLWGAVGFGFATLLGGSVSDAAGGGFGEVMVLYVGLMAISVVACSRLRYGGEGGGKGKDGKQGRSGGDHGEDSPRKGTQDGDTNSNGSTESERDEEEEESEIVSSEGEAEDRAGQPEKSKKRDKHSEGLASTVNGEAGDGRGVRLPEADEGKGGVLEAVKILLGSTESASFFAAVGLSGMGAGVIDTFLFIRVEELGGSHVLCGTARLVMCLSEVPFFYLSAPMIRKVGVRGVVAITEVAYLVRFIYYSVLETPWWILPSEVLHGLTFAAMWAATTDYAYRISPAHQRSTLQGLVTGIHWGFGFGFGAIGGGVLYAGVGARRCFLLSAALPSLALVLLCVPTVARFLRDSRARQRWGAVHTARGEGSYELVSKGGEVYESEGEETMIEWDVETPTTSATTSTS